MATGWRSHARGAALRAGALLGGALLIQGALAVVSARESLLFLVWSAPRSVRVPLAICAGGALLFAWFGARASRPEEDDAAAGRSRSLRRLALPLVAPGVTWALWDTLQVWRLGLGSAKVELNGLGWLPLSLVFAAALAAPVLLANLPREEGRPRRLMAAARWAVGGALLLLLVLFAILTTGRTDYQRNADVAVVLGARAYTNHEPSDALRDRIMTGVRLYREGRVKRLLMTGGMSAGGTVSEPQVMRSYAAERGVPRRAIILDEAGDNTAASIRNLAALKRRHGLGRILIVSHDYHTLRLKMSCHRVGLTCYTVPAEQPRRLRAEPYYIAREVAAVLHYAVFFR